MTTIRIATRASDLAMVQARYVAGRIEAELGAATEIVALTTKGDKILNVSLAKIGGKGLFVKEIEDALLDGRADVAVHSAKDLPAELADGLSVVAFPERADCRDALVSREPGGSVDSLREGARVGTGSARRAAQLSEKRPDIQIMPLRGNVATRLRKLDDENLDAIILACAGLDRLDLTDRIAERIDTTFMLPAVAQGALALETRSDDSVAQEIAKLDDPETAYRVRAERGFLQRLGGDCSVPLACLADLTTPETLSVRALVSSLDGSRMVRDEVEIAVADAQAGGTQLAERILGAGGEELLAELRAEDNA
jgi:hydroxymethylbilane synthase